jgi:hypothetical protein
MYEIRHYLTQDGKDIYLGWLKQVRDNVAKMAVVRRVSRIEQGNLGDTSFVVMACGSCASIWVRGTGVLRHRGPTDRFTAVWWRQTDTEQRH